MIPNTYICGRKARKILRKSQGYGAEKNEYAYPTTSGLTDLYNTDIQETTRPYGYGCTPNELSNDNVYFGTSDHASEGGNGGNEQSNLMNTSSDTSEEKIKSPFPDLVILYHPFMEVDGVKLVSDSLQEFNNYGPLSLQCVQIQRQFKVSVSYNGMILAEGDGLTRKIAEKVAGDKLLQTLRLTNYAIEPKSSYFPKRNVPLHVQCVDPKDSHIYKVVNLKRPNVKDVFHLSGAVDYVQTENELWQYIDDHIKSGSNADLYVMNINPKACRHKALQFAKDKSFIFPKRLLGCSNKVVAIFGHKSINTILQELKACGGENIKYRLVPPGAKMSTLHPTNATSQEKDLHSSFDTKSAVDKSEKSDQEHGEMNNVGQIDLINQEEIEIPQCIADNLILMDFSHDNNQLKDDYHKIKLSVLKCPALEEVIVDTKFDSNTTLYTSEIQIDKKVVGRAKGFCLEKLKKEASNNAVQNLKKSCVHIKAKMSYFQQFPPVFNDETSNNKIFSEVNPWEGIGEEDYGNILLRFRDSNTEDLFFCKNLKMSDRKLIFSMAKDMDLLVRYSSKTGPFCVYKKRDPMEIYKLLMKIGENEKYTLIIPPKRSNDLTLANNVESFGSKESTQESKIKNVFDYKTQSVNPSQEVKMESNQSEICNPDQSLTSKQNERDLYNYMPLENNRDQYLPRSVGQNQGWHSRTNKRSYDDGPGSGEEQALSSSDHSYNDQRTFESRQSFKEKKSREFNYQSREGQDSGYFPRHRIQPRYNFEGEESQEFNYQSGEGRDNSSFPRYRIDPKNTFDGKGTKDFNYQSRECHDNSSFPRRRIDPKNTFEGERSQEFNYQSRECHDNSSFPRRKIGPNNTFEGEGTQDFNYQSRECQNISFSRHTVVPVGETSREGQGSGYFPRHRIQPRYNFEGEGSQEFHYQSREGQDNSFPRHTIESVGEGSQELNFPPKEVQKNSIGTELIDYNNMNRNQKHSNYEQYYQKEKRGDNDRHYNSRGLWSNEIKKNYDQRF